MLDWQGKMKETRDRQHIVLEDIQEDVNMSAPFFIGHIEHKP